MNRTYITCSDENILVLISENDQEAFAELYERYFKTLFNYSYSKLNDQFAAQEIVQELFVNLWQQRHKYGIDACRSYLFAATKNLIISYYRKELTRQKHYNQWEISQSADTSLTDQGALTSDLQTRYEKGLYILPTKCREVFELSRNGSSNKEIASQLSISEKTVEQHITKALRILKTHLREHLPYLLILAQLND